LVEGTCPICGYEIARGDQCDQCGNLLDAIQLIKPRNRNLSDDVLTIRESDHFMWDLPQQSEAITAYLSDKDTYWRPQVINFARNFAKDLQPRAFTRDLTWGIPIPLPNNEGKCIYVWWEAVLGYLSATIEWAKLNGDAESWKDFWYANDTTNGPVKIYNFLGKDNILFHTVLWQGILLGMQNLGGDNAPRPTDNAHFNLPFEVPANQYLNFGGQKFSKSLGVSINALELAQKYGGDALRFYLSQILPESKDAEFSFDDFAARNNGDLLAKWGNLVQRTLSQIWRNYDGAIPAPGELNEADVVLIRASEVAFDTVGAAIDAVRLREALGLALELATKANVYLDQQAPWKTIKQDRDRAATQLYVVAQVIDSLSILLSPFVPHVCEAVHKQLGYLAPIHGKGYIENQKESTRDHLVLRYDPSLATGQWKPSNLPAGQKLGGEPKGLVAKIELTKT
jgi:methionyl-tRNA synthetase